MSEFKIEIKSGFNFETTSNFSLHLSVIFNSSLRYKFVLLLLCMLGYFRTENNEKIVRFIHCQYHDYFPIQIGEICN